MSPRAGIEGGVLLAECEGIRLRRGVVADAGELAAFAARTFAETFAAANRPEDMRAHLAASYGIPQQTRELSDPDVVTLLVHRNATLIAYAQVRRKTPPACVTHDSPIELHRFYVDRPAHGSGVAPALMSSVRKTAYDAGGRHLWLCVWERNARALTFYAKEGFVDVGSTDFYVGPDRQTDRVLMAHVGPGA